MPTDLDLIGLTSNLRRRGELVARSVYECQECGERYLGERRCPDCGRWCRRLGIGGTCPECDHVLAMIELMDEEGQ
jgi:ribosomal protein L32